MSRYITGWDDPARVAKLRALAKALPFPDIAAMVEQLAKAETIEEFDHTRQSLRPQFDAAYRYWLEPISGKGLARAVMDLFPDAKPEPVVTQNKARLPPGSPLTRSSASGRSESPAVRQNAYTGQPALFDPETTRRNTGGYL